MPENELPKYQPDMFAAPEKECDVGMKGGITSGVVYPYAVLELARRYRFRWLNTGPSRFYQLFVLGPNNSTKSFWQISTDGNLLERPVQVNSSRFSVAERVDVIVEGRGNE